MASVPSTVTTATCSHHSLWLTFWRCLKIACVCFSHRWICYRVSCEDKQWSEMCLETHVCQQWAWSPGVQERNPDNGKAAPQSGDCLFTVGQGRDCALIRKPKGACSLPWNGRMASAQDGVNMGRKTLLLPCSLSEGGLRRRKHLERTDQFLGQRNRLGHWE